MNQFTPIDVINAEQIQIQWKWIIECVNPKHLSDDDIDQLWKLEQDMWAHWLKEYVKCLDCWNIDWKYDIYPEQIYGLELVKKTVFDIESLLWGEICCSKCWWETEHVFSQDYRWDISSRYEFPVSFICIFRDTLWKIQWFMDWYVTDFDTIYEREFDHYYSNIWREDVKRRVEGTLWKNIPDELLCIPALWVSGEFANMFVIYSLMRMFFQAVLLYDPKITWIYESVLGTNTHWFYHVCWGKRIFATEWNSVENTHEWLESDIFIHNDLPIQSVSVFWNSLRMFLKNNKWVIKEIVELHK